MGARWAGEVIALGGVEGCGELGLGVGRQVVYQEDRVTLTRFYRLSAVLPTARGELPGWLFGVGVF